MVANGASVRQQASDPSPSLTRLGVDRPLRHPKPTFGSLPETVDFAVYNGHSCQSLETSKSGRDVSGSCRVRRGATCNSLLDGRWPGLVILNQALKAPLHFRNQAGAAAIQRYLHGVGASDGLPNRIDTVTPEAGIRVAISSSYDDG
jgi:hypothetical protein